MELNVKKFKEFLKKATFNFSIDGVSISVDGEENIITSAMVTQSGDVVTFLERENDVFLNVSEDFTISFIEPKTRVMSLINLIDDKSVDCEVKEDHLRVVAGKQKNKLYFCSDTVVTTLPLDSVKTRATEIIENMFFTTQITDEMLGALKKIKKIGQRFGYVYFDIRNGGLSIETTSRENMFSDSLSFSLFSGVEYENKSICFYFKNIANLLSVIQGNESEFTMGLTYDEENSGGVLMVHKGDEEKYFIMSLVEEEKLN